MGNDATRIVSEEKGWNDDLKKFKGITSKSIAQRRKEAMSIEKLFVYIIMLQDESK